VTKRSLTIAWYVFVIILSTVTIGLNLAVLLRGG
jgi:hypothetical protein